MPAAQPLHTPAPLAAPHPRDNPDQRPYLDTLTRWLKDHGHTILAAPGASPPAGESTAGGM